MCLSPRYCHDGLHDFRPDVDGNMRCVRVNTTYTSPLLPNLPCDALGDPVVCTCFDPDWTRYVGCAKHSPEGAKESYPPRSRRHTWNTVMRKYVSPTNPDYDNMGL